jgi:GMP synthase (glutamine-hydrolysing)
MQLMAHHLGGQVEFSARREYGPGMLHVTNSSQLFDGIGEQIDIWSSHGDKVTALPAGFRAAARSENSQFGAIEDPERKLYGLQFHPEVGHTPRGKEILQNFVYHSCRCAMDWTMGSLLKRLCAHQEAGRRSRVVSV